MRFLQLAIYQCLCLFLMVRSRILYPIHIQLSFFYHQFFFRCPSCAWYRTDKTKLDSGALKCVFFGYSKTQNGYKCYCPNLNKFVISVDVTCSECKPYFENDLSVEYIDGDPVCSLWKLLLSSAELTSSQEALESLTTNSGEACTGV